VRNRTIVSVLVGVGVSTLCLWYAFHGLDLAAIATEMSRVGAMWIGGSVLGGLLSLLIRAIRWRLLLSGVKSIGTGSLVSATFIGFMANNLLPARMGEVVRGFVLARREQTPVATVLGSILVERLLDVLAALAILGLCLAVYPDKVGGATTLLKQSGFLMTLLAGIGLAGLLIMVRYREQLLQFGQRWSMRLDRRWAMHGLDLFRQLLEGLCAFRGVAQVAAVGGLSFLIWGTAIASFYMLGEGFGLGLSVVQTSLVFIIVLFGVAIPSAPGFIGTFHGFCVAGLTMLAGIEQTLAAAYATLLHGSQWFAVNVVGIGCLISDRSLTWSGMANMARREREQM